MNLAFYRCSSGVDGSLTFMVRIGARLLALGHQVSYIFTSDVTQAIQNLLPPGCRVYRAKEILQGDVDDHFSSVDVIHAGVDGDELPKVFVFRDLKLPKAAIVFGAWSSDAFIHSSLIGFSPDGLRYKRFLRMLPVANITFMGPTIMEKHADFAKRDFCPSTIIPNAVDVGEVFIARGLVDRSRLVTIGRLAASKEHLFGAIDIVAELAREGMSIQFDIYGEGPYRIALQQKIEALSLGQLVRLKGEIPYAGVPAALRTAGIFLGMGASALEAAALGIPSLQAIEYTPEPVVYGWLHEMTDGEVGEYKPGKPQYSLKHYLRLGLAWSDEDYLARCEQSFVATKKHSIERIANLYLEFAARADRGFRFTEPGWLSFLIKLSRQPFKLLAQNRQKTIGRAYPAVIK